jgi:hypothetical protein
MLNIPLKNGKWIAISSLDDIMGTIWVRRIDYRRAGFTNIVKKQLRDSLKNCPNIQDEDDYPTSR